MKAVRMFGVAAVALLMFCSGVFVLAGNENDAATINIDGTDYDVSEINVAPGYKWTYTAQFPSDLTGTVLSMDTANTTDALESKVTITGNLVEINFAGLTVGNDYTLVLKAVHAASGQTTYQAIKFTIVSGIAITPTNTTLDKNFVISEDGSDAYTFDIVTGIGTVNAGSIKVNGTDVTGTAIEGGYSITVDADTVAAGKKSISVEAMNSYGETATKTYTYIVYDKLVAPTDLTIYGFKTSENTWNLVPAQTGTTDATFGTQVEITSSPEGNMKPLNYTFSEDFKTLSRTGHPDVSADWYCTMTVTTTGMVGHEQQTATFQVAIVDEPEFTLDDGEDAPITVFEKMDTKTVTFSASAETTDKTWSVNPATGMTFADGVATIDKDTTPGTYTVKLVTKAGQEKTHDIVIQSEETFVINGATTLSPVVSPSGTDRTYEYSIDKEIAVNWSITSELPVGVTASITDGVLSIQSASPVSAFELTIMAESASGNHAELTINVTVYNVLVFQSQPSNGAIAFPTN